MAAPPAASNHAFSITARAAGQAIAQLSAANGEEPEEGKEGGMEGREFLHPPEKLGKNRGEQ